VVTDSSGNVKARYDYLPFGEEIPSTVGGRSGVAGYGASDGIRQKWTGKERDSESGLDYFLARYYSSAQGRFTSVDKIVIRISRLLDPQRFNLYGYTRNNPLTFIDPDGLDVKDPKITRTTYKVQGNTASEATENAKSNNPAKTGHAGQTTWDYTYTYGFTYSSPVAGKDEQSITATVNDKTVEVNTEIKVITPEWEGYDKASPEEQKRWDEYSKSLNEHEEGHVQIAVKGANDVEAAIKGTAATGTAKTVQGAKDAAKKNLDSEVDKKTTAATQKVQERSDQYDKDTDNGRKRQ
jgi:RHS repeat-associated protein